MSVWLNDDRGCPSELLEGPLGDGKFGNLITLLRSFVAVFHAPWSLRSGISPTLSSVVPSTMVIGAHRAWTDEDTLSQVTLCMALMLICYVHTLLRSFYFCYGT